MSIFTDGGCWCYECPSILKPDEERFCRRCLSYGVKEGKETPEALKLAIKNPFPDIVSWWRFIFSVKEIKFENRYRKNCKNIQCIGYNKINNTICTKCILYNDINNICNLCKKKGTHKLGEFCAERCKSPEEIAKLDTTLEISKGSWIDNSLEISREPYSWM